ncbi:hypothetical protein EN829_015085 [Mesorhizobium sp. M00.F.Ca.ET.186.01.1.1]|nr:hypothetical protein EN848_14350 [bacterium M00.F.Ca.ET.205.01.1.1]TGU53005.1 hypothetical protein EN795_15045 [bacterium M00.F.Ca.ET.152.01.1.1]TGV35974.1 hypothetical protein EN829_015085 [Mesorhizobium sp. M00.F.Ca.ET.186.01.1.1]TGZ43557.1 hypothetical protein EN805_10655 [bacterium M00.F.Ca.ET.162.01.1.1]
MPQAYGSVAHPVDLGPFSRIVEVHWPNPVQFISFPLLILRSSVVKDYPYPGAASGEVTNGRQPWDWTADVEDAPLAEDPVTPNSVNYITGFQYEWASTETTPSPGYGGFGKRDSGSGWGPLKIDAFEGLPSLPDERSLTPWTVVLSAYGTTNTIFSWYPRAEYQALAGEALPDMGIPNHESIAFQGAPDATLQMRGAAFLEGAPLQGTGFFGGNDGTVGRDPYTLGSYYCKYGVTGFWDPITGEGMDYVFSPLSIDVSGIRVSYKGKTYRGIGAAVQPDGDTVAPTTPGVLWILCEKETAP